jgi:SAM-dependent methyltransferase
MDDAAASATLREPWSVARAFDAAAAAYDETWGTNPVGLLFRWTFQERLAALFPRGSRVLDLGCGTGEDAVFLAGRGVSVGAVDISPAMIATARAKAERRGVAAAITFACGDLATLPGMPPSWDGVYSDFGALNCVDLDAVARRLGELLRPEAPAVFSVMGRWPLPALVHRALTGRGRPRVDGPVTVSGREVRVRYDTLGALRAALSTTFRITRVAALGVVVPDPGYARWVEAHPQTFGALAMTERAIRALPVLRALGDHLLIEGRRR